MRPWWMLVAVACGGGAAATLDAPQVDAPAIDTAATGLVVTQGSADPSFGSGGMVTVDFGGTDYPWGAALLPSGRLLVAVATVPASGSPTSQLVAFTTDGAMDTSFGSGGAVPLDFFGGLLGTLSDGSMIIEGEGELEHRFADGSLDPAYGSGGHASGAFVIGGQPVPIFVDSGNYGYAVDASGRVYAGAQQSDGHVLISRLTANGQPDYTFGDGAIQAGYGVPWSFALVSDGSLMVAIGQGSHPVVLEHVLANGTVDPAFGGYLDGVDGPHCGVAIDTGGRTLLAGTAGSYATTFIARFGSTGALDPAFAGGYVQVPGSVGCIQLVARAAGGSLLSIGVGSPITAAVFALDDSGTRATQYMSTASSFRELLELPGGMLLAIGSTGMGSAQDLAIARFLP